MDCGTSLVKYVLFTFNTLVSIAAILGIIYGAIVLNSLGVIEVEGQYGFPPQAAIPIILISMCSIVLLISFMGCCGAIRESAGMTMCYAIFLLILLIVQMIMVVFLYVNKAQFLESIDEFVSLAWEQNSREAGYFSALERTFQCCGKNGFVDYGLTVQIPPPSCCPNNSCSFPPHYNDGCRGKIRDFMSGNTEYAKKFGIGLMSIELVGFIFATCLANNIRNSKRRHAY